MGNSVLPGESAHYEPSHMDLYCLQMSDLVWRAEGVKRPI